MTINTTQQAHARFEHTRTWLAHASEGEITLPSSIPLQLAVLPHTGGQTRSRWSGGRGVVLGIDMSPGLSTTHFDGCLIHELGECWLILQGIQPFVSISDEAREGFCQVCSLEFYMQRATPESHELAVYIAQHPLSTYRNGYWRVFERWEPYSLAEIARHVRKTKQVA